MAATDGPLLTNSSSVMLAGILRPIPAEATAPPLLLPAANVAVYHITV